MFFVSESLKAIAETFVAARKLILQDVPFIECKLDRYFVFAVCMRQCLFMSIYVYFMSIKQKDRFLLFSP